MHLFDSGVLSFDDEPAKTRAKASSGLLGKIANLARQERRPPLMFVAAACRMTVGPSRSAKALRAQTLPTLVISPRHRVSPVERAEKTKPNKVMN